MGRSRSTFRVEPASLMLIFLLVSPAAIGALEHYKTSSTSMFPGSFPGDRLIALKLEPDGGFVPARGDVVFFRSVMGEGEVWQKRVIGLPGDLIQTKSGRIWLNGEPLVQSETMEIDLPPREEGLRGIAALKYRETLPGGRTYDVVEVPGREKLVPSTHPFRVPDGHLFVVGDNRMYSINSRYRPHGPVPLENLVGISIATVWDVREQHVVWRTPYD